MFYHFNIPPNWVLAENFMPEDHFTPDNSWGQAPKNWKFWELRGYEIGKHKVGANPSNEELALVAAKMEADTAVGIAYTARLKTEFTAGESLYRQLPEEKFAEKMITAYLQLKDVPAILSSIPNLSFSAPPKLSPAPHSPAISTVISEPAEIVSTEEGKEFWNYLLHKIGQLNIFNLKAVKAELLATVAASREDYFYYDNVIHGKRWREASDELISLESRLVQVKNEIRERESRVEEELKLQRKVQLDQHQQEYTDNMKKERKEIFEIRQKKAILEDVCQKTEQKITIKQKILTTLNAELARREPEVFTVLSKSIESTSQGALLSPEHAALEAVSLYDYTHPAITSVQLQDQLKSVREQARSMVLDKIAVHAISGFTFNKSLEEGSKFVTSLSSLMLTAYNQEAENAIVKSTGGSKNMDAALTRLDKALAKVEKMGSMISMRIDVAYHSLRCEEIRLAFAHKDTLALEKVAEAERKAILREEALVLREAEKKRLQLEQEQKAFERQVAERLAQLEKERVTGLTKEQDHYKNVLNSQADIEALNASDTIIQELRAKLASLEVAKERNNNTIANTKAGYVYVISNVGAFGEGVVKIGLTRRQDPFDRVKELSGASVPFIFDVHALHFSDNAVELETALHRHFADKKVNKVNQRKEFFRVTPQEVRTAMMKLSKGALLTFTMEAEASEYRSSLEM